jgi:uncharacterized protein with von Willebrand factor type A (vWA) domain
VEQGLFLDLFYALRRRSINVSIQEWLALMKALSLGLEKQSLTGFYHLSRSLLVKTEAQFDAFDEAFLEVFGDLDVPIDLPQKLREWLADPVRYERLLSPDLIDKLRTLGLEELLKMFEERLREQKEAHHGGDRWIGTGGTSPFGHSGYHPSGLRIGGPGHARRAIRVAEERRFRAYRHDRVLDTRQIKVALRGLRELRREGQKEELDLESTIDRTCRNAGELELIFRAPRINNVRLLLMMDVGGTMEPYAHLVERLFSAAYASRHLKDFRFYFFHNCVYAKLYEDEYLQEPIPTVQVMRELDSRYKLVIVGDASMAPTELASPWGQLYRDEVGPVSGNEWLDRLSEQYARAVWINPEPPGNWRWGTAAAIGRIFPMFHLSIDGLDDAVQSLVGPRGVA